MNLQDIPKLVINLESRPDRLTLVKKELQDWNAYVIPGVPDKNPMLGIARAHLNCVQHAKDKGWSEVLIMEDDVQLRPGCSQYLEQAFECLPPDWEILLGGAYEANNLKYFNAFWDSVGEFCGLHFYIVRQSAYDKILEYDNKIHIDRWINYNGKRLKAYITNKYVAIQRDGFSDNVKAQTYYNDLILNKRKLL
jgi:GR25 family glycosyltransferase involved in LPS biosynthesis